MGVLAYHLLHMIRHCYVWGEKVKRSIEWLIKRLIKVEARVSYHARRWNVRGLRLFPWLTITVRCWAGVLKIHSSEISGF